MENDNNQSSEHNMSTVIMKNVNLYAAANVEQDTSSMDYNSAFDEDRESSSSVDTDGNERSYVTIASKKSKNKRTSDALSPNDTVT